MTSAQQLAPFLVQRADQIGAVVHRHCGLVVKGGVDMLVVGLVVLALDGEDRDLEMGDERGGHVVLRRERVGGRRAPRPRRRPAASASGWRFRSSHAGRPRCGSLPAAVPWRSARGSGAGRASPARPTRSAPAALGQASHPGSHTSRSWFTPFSSRIGCGPRIAGALRHRGNVSKAQPTVAPDSGLVVLPTFRTIVRSPRRISTRPPRPRWSACASPRPRRSGRVKTFPMAATPGSTCRRYAFRRRRPGFPSPESRRTAPAPAGARGTRPDGQGDRRRAVSMSCRSCGAEPAGRESPAARKSAGSEGHAPGRMLGVNPQPVSLGRHDPAEAG